MYRRRLYYDAPPAIAVDSELASPTAVGTWPSTTTAVAPLLCSNITVHLTAFRVIPLPRQRWLVHLLLHTQQSKAPSLHCLGLMITHLFLLLDLPQPEDTPTPLSASTQKPSEETIDLTRQARFQIPRMHLLLLLQLLKQQVMRWASRRVQW